MPGKQIIEKPQAYTEPPTWFDERGQLPETLQQNVPYSGVIDDIAEVLLF